MNDKITSRILVVDDQENWREALFSLLDKDDYSIEIVGSFEEAQKEINRHIFDLVILDVRLLDQDTFNVQGLELLKLAKAQKEAPKVMILTGYPESIHQEFLDENSPDALLLKVPKNSRFDSQSFKTQVQNLLHEKNILKTSRDATVY